MIRLVVLGQPATQGNKTPMHRNGKTWMVEGKGPGRQKFSDWRAAVRSEAQRYCEEHGQPMIDGPVTVQLFFGLPRPASAPKRRRTFPLGARSGDVDKLARAVLDAVTGVLFADDAQVVSLTVAKDFSERTGLIALINAHREDEPVLFPGSTGELDSEWAPAPTLLNQEVASA